MIDALKSSSTKKEKFPVRVGSVRGVTNNAD